MTTQGRVTLPVEEGMDEELTTIIECLGADAVRNSDGTSLPKIVSELGTKVYSTWFCARGDEVWALDHLDEHVSLYLCSDRVPAFEDGPLKIHIMPVSLPNRFARIPTSTSSAGGRYATALPVGLLKAGRSVVKVSTVW